MDASIFVQAVDTLHSPTATPAQRAAANDWLVAFAAVAEAPSVCEAVLRWPGASPAALCFAANVVANSAAQLGAVAAMPLLQLCASVPSRAAAARLAQAAAEAIVRAGGEAAFFDEPVFAQLDAARKLLVLQCVAEALEQHASPEELQCRPTTRAACERAMTLLEPAWMAYAAADGAASPSEAAAAVRCLTSWAACGIGYGRLCESHAPLLVTLLRALHGALQPCAEEDGADALTRTLTLTLPLPLALALARTPTPNPSP